ncbi:MAG: hypothetical protein EBR01_07410 [Proteobacteria bacterium]|nr:hypothetical protein [Pseudomonadota bacterium]
MWSDFEILKLITAKSTRVSLPMHLLQPALIKAIEWSFPSKKSLRRRIDTLSEAEGQRIIESINFWRKEANLAPLKRTSDKMFQVEIAHLAKLKAFQISTIMAKKGSPKQKKNWVLKTIQSNFFLHISKKTFLGDECLDRILGLNERKVKTELFGQNVRALYRNEDIYLDLDPEDLFTPYRVLVQISEKLKFKTNETLVDLGSGLGRVGIVLGLLNPKLNFLGLELMKERHSQAEKSSRNLGMSKRIKFQCSDLSKISIPRAETYYLFNPFSYLTLRRVFLGLKENAQFQKLRIVMAQVGRPPRMVRNHDWLKQMYLSPVDRNWRAHGFSIYETK